MELAAVVSAFFGAALGAASALIGAMLSERIRGRIANATWIAQERWKFKARFYSEFLELLDSERRALFTLAGTVERINREKGGQFDTESPEGKEIAKLRDTIATLRERGKRMRAVGAIWLSSEVLQAIEQLHERLESVSRHGGPGVFDYDGVIGVFRETQTAIVEATRRDLEFKVEGL